MTKLTPEEIVENLIKSGSKEWNEALSKRLESVKSYLANDEWEKGISLYLRAAQGRAMQKLLGESLPQNANDYLRGFIAGLQVSISLPKTVDGAIQGEEQKTKSGPKGDAGY